MNTSISSLRKGGLYSTLNAKLIVSIKLPTIVTVPDSPAPFLKSGAIEPEYEGAEPVSNEEASVLIWLMAASVATSCVLSPNAPE